MKGDSGVAIAVVILIVVAIGAFFILSGNNQFLSGLTAGIPIVFSNDVITATDKFVADKVPYEGQKTTIEFTVRNNGVGETKDVEVVLDPPTGFTSTIKCGDKPSCKFNLDESDATDVLITLTAIEGVTQIIPADVRYSIRYPYEGVREIHIPIVSDRDELPKGQAFFVSDPTFGPIQISVTPPGARPTSDGGSAVFAVNGIPVELEFRVENVGGGGFGAVRPVVMQGDDLKISRLVGFSIINCDKIDPKTSGLRTLATGRQTPVGVAGLEVPFDVSCTFEPKVTGELSEGVIEISYNYKYEILFSDQFSILPKSVPKIEAPTTVPTTAKQPEATELKAGTSQYFSESKTQYFDVAEKSEVTVKMIPSGGYNYDLYVRWDGQPISSKDDIKGLDSSKFCAPQIGAFSTTEACGPKPLEKGRHYLYVDKAKAPPRPSSNPDNYKLEITIVPSSEKTSTS